MNKMTDVEIAWIAGLMEGEGCFYVSEQKRYNKSGDKIRRSPRITCSSTDLDVISSLIFITGEGRLTETSRFEKRALITSKKILYRWDLNIRKEVLEFLRLVHPYMHSRRLEMIDSLLQEFGE